MEEDIFYLKANQNVIGQDILNLDKKVDKNKKEISDRLDENLYEISEIFQEISKRLDQNKIPKRKIAIL